MRIRPSQTRFAFTIDPIDDDVIDSIVLYMEQFEKAKKFKKENVLSEYGEHGTLTQYREFDADSQEIDKMVSVEVDEDPEVTVNGEDLLGSGSDVFRNAGKLVGIDQHQINNLIARNDSGDTSAFDQLSNIVYDAVQILIDREGVTHVDDASNSQMPGPMHADQFQQRMGRKKTYAEPFGFGLRENKMLIKESKLRQMILEEAEGILNEDFGGLEVMIGAGCGCNTPGCPSCEAVGGDEGGDVCGTCSMPPEDGVTNMCMDPMGCGSRKGGEKTFGHGSGADMSHDILPGA